MVVFDCFCYEVYDIEWFVVGWIIFIEDCWIVGNKVEVLGWVLRGGWKMCFYWWEMV